MVNGLRSQSLSPCATSNLPVNFRKYLVLAGVTVFAAAGDSMLSHGMKQVGSISVNHVQGVIFAVLNPWVAVGILLLLAFFATYMTALSWADLTYVLPATSLGYVILALVRDLCCMSMLVRCAG